MHDVGDYILNRMGGRKNYLTPCSQLSQETLWPYQAFVNHIMQKSKSSENSSPRCKMSFWHSLRCRPCPMWQEMLLRIPDLLSAFQECLGMRLNVIYLTFDWLNLLNLYICFCMSSVIVYKWKVVCSLQSPIINIYIAACKHAQSLVASSRLYTTEFHM